MTRSFCWTAVSVAVLFIGIHMMPRAWGQRDQQAVTKRSSHVETPSHVDGGTWTITGSLNTARFLHTATFLPSGMVLVAGGLDNGFHATATAELYDPASGSWTAIGSLNTGRYEHTATLLANGQVLVAGGSDSSGNASPTAELYDPVTLLRLHHRPHLHLRRLQRQHQELLLRQGRAQLRILDRHRHRRSER